MPFEIDTEKMANLQTLDMGNPPLRPIPVLPYPRVVYLHPKRKFKKIVTPVPGGNGAKEEKVVATEHLTKVVRSESEHEAAKAQGWKDEPYIPADASPFALCQEYDVPDPDQAEVEPVTAEQKSARKAR